MSSKAYDTLKAIVVMVLINLFWLSVLTLFLCNNDFPNGNKTVYTTRTGECYHLKGCDTLQYSKYKTTLREAVDEGYISCSWCDSPVLKGRNGFEYEGYIYFTMVPFAAMFAYAATSDILGYDDIHYIIHLLVNAGLAKLIDIIF